MLICFRLLCITLVLSLTVRPLQAAGGAEDSYDILFFASDGPAFLRVTLASSGVGIQSVRQRYATVLLESLDQDDDGQLNEAEAREIPAGGRFAAEAETLDDRWAELDTSPTDGIVSPDELLAFLDPLLGERFASRPRPPLLVQSVQLHPRLDRNGDRQISRDEIEAGIETLRQFDFDDDETFSPAELQPFPQSMIDAQLTSTSGKDGRVFVLLDKNEPLAPLVQRLIDTYGDAGATGVTAEQMAMPAEAFAHVDGDGDGHLNAEELTTLLHSPAPDALILVDLRRRRVTFKPGRRGTDRVEEVPDDSRGQLTLRVGDETLEFSARDNRYQASDQVSFLKIEFRRQDGDKNGYLGPEEFGMLTVGGASFEDVDLNSDGQVYLDELDRFMRLDAYLAQCYAEMTIDEVEKPLFQILDENLDRRLTQKEFDAGLTRMQPYDRDGDGFLDASELQALRKYRIAFSFGVPPAVRIERQNQMDADRRLPVMQRSGSGPEWFGRMDRNQDGDVTWREFLGPREAFDQLDIDASGWIDAVEAESGGS
ncbi:MAG: EF-hand domain-containing protein [Planctomycetaceae bacterium]|nr:EF-hand domain-containing protein [Planctomycetaceae bacterium]